MKRATSKIIWERHRMVWQQSKWAKTYWLLQLKWLMSSVMLEYNLHHILWWDNSSLKCHLSHYRNFLWWMKLNLRQISATLKEIIYLSFKIYLNSAPLNLNAEQQTISVYKTHCHSWGHRQNANQLQQHQDFTNIVP